FRNEAPSQPRRREADRQVEEKNRPPAYRIHQPAADERADSAREGADTGPRADCLALGLVVEARAEERQAVWHQHRSPDPPRCPSCEEDRERGCGCTDKRSCEEQADAAEKQAASAIAIACRAAQEDQRTERQEVGVDQPGKPVWPGVQVAVEGRKRHIYD